MDVIGDDRLREYTHRASSRRSRDAIRHTSHIFLSDARLTSVGMPGDVGVECELSMSGFAHRPSPSRPTPRPCRGVTRPNTLGVDRPPRRCPGVSKRCRPRWVNPGAMPRGLMKVASERGLTPRPCRGVQDTRRPVPYPHNSFTSSFTCEPE